MPDQNPAESASKIALQKLFKLLENEQNFIFEAGAGAGKTYSLVKGLQFLINKHEREFIRRDQRIACITYTNVAKNQIVERTNGNPVVTTKTIHSLAWSLIKGFQTKLKRELPSIGKWEERIAESEGIIDKTVNYDLGYPKISGDTVWLHHNDIIELFVRMLNQEKFRSILTNKYPIILIDEYQDTDKKIAKALLEHFIEQETGPLIGFFGDHWQMIYGTTACGKIESEKLDLVEKKANFRSEKNIVAVLNNMRPTLTQHEKDPSSSGEISVFHSNDWQGERRSGGHWSGDLPEEIANDFFSKTKVELERNGWNFNSEDTKILMLTHNLLASKQGYQNLYQHFRQDIDKFVKKEDPFVAFFAETFEPAILAYQESKYGDMFTALENRTPIITKHSDKDNWRQEFDHLLQLKSDGTIGDIVYRLIKTKRPRMPDKLERQMAKYLGIIKSNETNRTDEENNLIRKMDSFLNIAYQEMSNGVRYINEQTPFSTKHGVKGEQYENVFVVLGRGWNQYNFGSFLEWSEIGIPSGKLSSFERNRNLFYVSCSRPMKRLALLFTQELSDSALITLEKWFGGENIHPAPN